MARATLDRRNFLRLSGAAAAAGWAGGASAQDMVQTLIEQTRRGDFGQDFDSGSRNAGIPATTLPTLSARTIQATERAIPEYEGIVARGGWPFVPAGQRLRLGMRHGAVIALRRRLAAGGDLDPRAGTADTFDSYVEAAVRRFQTRHGLTPDGVVSGATFGALNVAAAMRLSQLRTNLVRLRIFSGNLGDRYILCNIPGTQIEAIDNGIVVSRHSAVVGKPDRASPDIQSKVVEVNFNPYWTVPASIVRKDLIPKMQAQPDYLTQNRIRIIDPRGFELQPSQINWYSNDATRYMFKQDPGDFNSLGTIRINFPSAHGVYMHDTPLKNLFGEDLRFHSSGCVRVQNVRELVTWLLDGTPGWSRAEIDRVIRSGERRNARPAHYVGVYWVYVTAWASADGTVQFRDDIYARDGIGSMAAMRG
jgi:murein L,D-transpeptidase YcbB/YkuD